MHTELPYSVSGIVIRGKHLGTQIGFPTANLEYNANNIGQLQDGVYVATAHVEDDPHTYLAIVDQGKHPTAADGRATVEAHLIDYPEQPLYGKKLDLVYLAYLRGETLFPSLDALVEQLKADRDIAIMMAKQENGLSESFFISDFNHPEGE